MPGENVCSVCGATFTRPQHVGRHMRSHTGDKPYHCKQCPEKFARSDLLSRHVNKTHGPPMEGDGKGDGKNGMVNKKKGRKPKFTSATAALSTSIGQAYQPPFSNQPQQTTGEQQHFPQGQHLPYNPRPPFHGSYQQPPARSFAQTQVDPHSGATTISPGATFSSTGAHVGMPQNQSNGIIYTLLQDNGRTSGFEVDNEEEDDDAWIDMPNDHSNRTMATLNSVPPCMMQQPYTTTAPSQSQMPMLMAQQQFSVPPQPYPQQYTNFYAMNSVPAHGPVDTYMPTFNASSSPGVTAMQNIIPSSTSTSSPYTFWSGSTPQSSPLRHALPTYAPPAAEGVAVTTNPILTSSTSPYDFAESAFPRYDSNSPSTAGVDITKTKGNSPLAPAPAGMTSLGPIPTTYSSVMPAPLIPTGTPIADKVEKIKKRACESCNQSKVKCDFGIPCGKCAARKISCKYPTGRKSSRKLTTSASPLALSTSDGAKLASVSPSTSNMDFQPMVAPKTPKVGNDASPPSANAGSLVERQTQIPFDGQQGDGSAVQVIKPEERRPSHTLQMADPLSMPAHSSDAFTRQPLLTDRPQHTASFVQMRQTQDDDGQSTASGYTFGHPSQADSRRSSMASTFASEDGHQVNNSLPFSTLSLAGSNATDVHQWVANATGITPNMTDTNFTGPNLSPMDQSDFVIESPAAMMPPTYFWQIAADRTDPKPIITFVPPGDLQTQRMDSSSFARPTLPRGRSNSFPMLYTPRGGVEGTQYFVPVPRDLGSGSSLEQSALPQDWTAQIRHMATQLNRNGSGTSSLQQVDETLVGTAQSSPQNNEIASDGGLASAHPGNPSFNLGRPQPGVLQSSKTNAMAKQLLANRGSLQTLAPERTPSFLIATPSSELDGMKWPSALPHTNVPGTLLSPFKMPNHLARPGNKRLPSQTLGPDSQKRQSISLTQDELNGHNLLDAADNHMAGVVAPQSTNQSGQFSGRRASMPTWLPDTTSGSGPGPVSGISPGGYSFNSQPTGRSVVNHSPGVGMTFYPDLTPTLFDPLPQGFNFNPASTLTTPTMERVSFNIPAEEAKPVAAWTIQA